MSVNEDYKTTKRESEASRKKAVEQYFKGSVLSGKYLSRSLRHFWELEHTLGALPKTTSGVLEQRYSQAQIQSWREIFRLVTPNHTPSLSSGSEIHLIDQPTDVVLNRDTLRSLGDEYIDALKAFYGIVSSETTNLGKLPQRPMLDLVKGGWRFSAKAFGEKGLSTLMKLEGLVEVAGRCQPYSEIY